MPTAMEIPVSAPGIGDAVRQMAQFARQVQQVATAQRQLTSGTRSLSQAQRQQADPQRDLQRILSRGPIARIQRLQAAQAVAQTPEQQQDVGIMLAQAQRRLLLLQRRGAGGAGALARIGEAVASSRVGLGGGGVQFMPLVSRVMDVLESLPGPVGVVAKVMATLGAAVVTATKNIQELASASAQSGGTVREVATLRGLGIDPGQIAGRAAALRERLLTDPGAVGAANRLGLPPATPIIAGGQNNARILLQAADAIRKLTSAEDRLREARLLGEESLVELARVSDYVYAGIKRDAAATAVIVNDAATQAQADLSAGWGRFVDSTKLLATAIGIPLMKLAGPVLNALADGVNSVALAVNALISGLDKIGVLPQLLNPFAAAIGNLQKAWDALFGGGKDDQALRDNTDALNKNSQVLQQGMYGGGERLRGALPGAMGGELLRRGMEGNAIRFGAFGLG